MVVRTAGMPAAVRRMIRATHGEVPILRLESLREMLDEAVASRRFVAHMGLLFAASTTFLAALGIYRVISLASHPEVFGLVMGKAARMAAASAAVGPDGRNGRGAGHGQPAGRVVPGRRRRAPPHFPVGCPGPTC